ncbi:Transcriptional activator protein NhaR [Saliniradius amylolyticus]|uniref:Transcriptional activator protein NhaR n=1 Tax=Saliniradius amylolyticus TaxID=2183582 RepID=A0A2S2E742_9ALTE|nr:LysR family transcriptional regulator [Saliniradius amylolyticus]AWL13455.1 Transcriptional activator protein NhaR [Saliniradius amylolyticus]
MPRLNYHHLYYFWRVAKGGNLTRVASELHVSQSALSMQIKQLEESLQQTLFERRGRKLHLTESGHIALSYAEQIFEKGEELSALMRDNQAAPWQTLRIGVVATLSRNFVDGLIGPLLRRTDVALSLRSGGLDGLLNELAEHQLDMVLSNVPVNAEQKLPWRCQRIAQQAASIIGHAELEKHYGDYRDLARYPVLVPGPSSDVRTGFELQCEQWGIRPQIKAEVDDMAMLRLVARDSQALAIMPAVVVKDEIARGELVELDVLPNAIENFYAISIRRQFEHPVIRDLMTHDIDAILKSSQYTGIRL